MIGCAHVVADTDIEMKEARETWAGPTRIDYAEIWAVLHI